MRIDLNAKTPEIPERQSSSETSPSKRLSNTGTTLPADETNLATHSRVQELQSQMQQMPEDRAAKVEALARAIRGGEYNVGADQIAQAMMSDMTARSVLF